MMKAMTPRLLAVLSGPLLFFVALRIGYLLAKASV